MKIHRIAALFLSLVLAFSLAACGQGASSASSASSSAASSAAAESKTEEQLLAEENEILSANDALWEKVFSSMDKNVTETTISANYGDFLLSAVEKAKDQFSDEEYKTLTADAEKIRAIEEQIAALAPAEDAASSAAAQGNAFPKFEGSDLEGNPVDNSLFAGNAFTVVNFWFNGCKPCVEELDDLNALNEKVKAQGGEVIGINTETLDGNQQGIDAAKKLLETTGASYRNIYFASGSEAGKFALNIMAFPTTYVFDRDGNVVGQPLLGGIDKEENLAALQKNTLHSQCRVVLYLCRYNFKELIFIYRLREIISLQIINSPFGEIIGHFLGFNALGYYLYIYGFQQSNNRSKQTLGLFITLAECVPDYALIHFYQVIAHLVHL